MQKHSKSFALIGKPVSLNERESIAHQPYPEDEEEEGVHSNRSSKTHELISELSRDKMVRKNKFDIKKSAPILENVDYDIDVSTSTFTRKSIGSKSPTEKSSFGTKHTRFPAIKESFISPASYTPKKASKNSIDFNVKGYGGLVSKKERFDHLPYLNTGPGPGQYSQNANFFRGPNIYHAFHPPKFPRSPKVIPLVYHYNNPGPGSYTLNESLTKKSISNYASVFKSSSQRGISLL